MAADVDVSREPKQGARIAPQQICRQCRISMLDPRNTRDIRHHERLSRRSFLAASAMLAAGPAFSAPRAADPRAGPEVGRSGSVDVVIVGAGAAGIAAARRLAAAGKRFALIEAAERSADAASPTRKTFGVPYDRGAHWIYTRRHQSGGEARAADRARSLSGAARPAHAHRPALRARRRDGGFSRRAGARQRRHRGRRARQGRCRMRAGLAQGPRRLAADASSSCSAPTAAARSSRKCPPSTSPRRRARQWCILPPRVGRAAREARAGLPCSSRRR